MRPLHAFLAAVGPLVILSACTGPKADSPSPQAEGSRIVSLRLLTPDGRTVEVKPASPDVDAVFTSADVLDSVLIPYYEGKGETVMADELREARDSVRTGAAYALHKLHSRSFVDSIE